VFCIFNDAGANPKCREDIPDEEVIMANQSFGTAAKDRQRAMSYPLIGAAVGAVAGGGIGYFTGPQTASGTMVMTIIGLVVGAIAGAIAGFLVQFVVFSNDQEQDKGSKVSARSEGIASNNSMKLKEERLDITKEHIQLNEVSVHREQITENKTITVPVVHEEVVIETRSAEDPQDEAKHRTIRIPVKEEEIEVVKHTVVTGDVDIHKEEYVTTEVVTEQVKHEVADLEISGEAKVKEHTSETPRS
jgi:uncharacterized protein (TIGR02271 family)